MTGRIGIFGGVFDPVHVGHISIARSFLNSKLIHNLLILPSPSPPHKQNAGITSFRHRLEMLKLAFEEADNLSISDLESTLPSPSYSLQTLNYLQTNYPSALFYLCMGEDSLGGFQSWYKYTEILEKVTLVVAERPGFSRDEIPDVLLENSIFVDHTPVNISSTQIRRQSNLNLQVEWALPEPVLHYVEKHKLYGNPWAKL
jgi:nicotinate-nucleotide adenylyltransferase